MNPFDFARSVTDFWTSQAKGWAGGGLEGGAMPPMPTDLSAGAAELARAGQSMMEMWSSATAMSGTLAAGMSRLRGADTTAGATLRKMMDPRSWLGGPGEMDDVLSRMAEGPRLADLWDVERRYSRVLQTWMTVRRAALEHNMVVLQAWMRASSRFGEALAPKQSKGLDPKAAMALWTETANLELLETQRSDAFLKTQTAMIRATTELRMAQQELVEHFGRQYGFPTRSELDDVHRTVTELRREVRALRHQQRQAAAPTPPPVVADPPAVLPASRRVAVRQRGKR